MSNIIVPVSFGIFIFGMLIGSFLNVVIYRIPKGESIVFPSSHCTKCNQKLKWYHNIPLFSWLLLGGRCAYCQEPISRQYPIIEFLTGILWLSLFLKLGLVWYLPFVAISFSALLALTVIDIKYYAVPDSVNIFALVVALVQSNYMDAFINSNCVYSKFKNNISTVHCRYHLFYSRIWIFILQ